MLLHLYHVNLIALMMMMMMIIYTSYMHFLRFFIPKMRSRPETSLGEIQALTSLPPDPLASVEGAHRCPLPRTPLPFSAFGFEFRRLGPQSAPPNSNVWLRVWRRGRRGHPAARAVDINRCIETAPRLSRRHGPRSPDLVRFVLRLMLTSNLYMQLQHVSPNKIKLQVPISLVYAYCIINDRKTHLKTFANVNKNVTPFFTCSDVLPLG